MQKAAFACGILAFWFFDKASLSSDQISSLHFVVTAMRFPAPSCTEAEISTWPSWPQVQNNNNNGWVHHDDEISCVDRLRQIFAKIPAITNRKWSESNNSYSTQLRPFQGKNKWMIYNKFCTILLYFCPLSEPSSYADRVLAHVRPKENISDEPSVPLKVNDRIVWITDDSLEYGVVKWIGQLLEGSEVVAGIEFVSSFGIILPT